MINLVERTLEICVPIIKKVVLLQNLFWKNHHLVAKETELLFENAPFRQKS